VLPHVIFSTFYGHSINFPVPYFSYELFKIKSENEKYGIDEDFQGLKKKKKG